MEHHNISKVLDDSTASNFVIREWIEINELSNGQHANKNIRFKSPMVRSDCVIIVKHILL